jgi:hypothetical protein
LAQEQHSNEKVVKPYPGINGSDTIMTVMQRPTQKIQNSSIAATMRMKMRPPRLWRLLPLASTAIGASSVSDEFNDLNINDNSLTQK